MRHTSSLTASRNTVRFFPALALALAGSIALPLLHGCSEIPCASTVTRYPLGCCSILSDIAKRMETNQTLAASFAMIEDGDIFCSAAFGWRDKENGLTATDETLFNFGSCAKVITSMAVMKLVEQGKLSLDGSVMQYFPEFQMADPRAADITVRMLLNHSSGLPGTTLRGAITVEPANDEHMAIVLDNLAQDRLKTDPGAFSVYCNDGFSVAEMLIAHVSGKRYSLFVKDEIFTPLGIAHAHTADAPYVEGSRVANRQPLAASPYEVMNTHGAGGFSITASEWCLLLDMLGNGGVSSKGVRVLAESSVAAMAEDQTLYNFWPADSAGFGLGWDTVRLAVFDQIGIVALAKSGGTDTYTSQVIVLPQYKLGVAISCVGGNLGVSEMAALALEEILKCKGVTGGFAPLPEHAEEAAFPAGQRAFAGYYGIGAALFRVQFADGNRLGIYGWADGEWAPASEGLTWRASNRFAAADASDEYFFEDVAGHGVYLMHAAPKITGTLPRAISPFAQKIEGAEVAEDVAAAWDARTGVWLRANTLPDSMSVKEPNMNVEIVDDLPGIVLVDSCPLRMYSALEARMFLEIPVNPGRDMNDAQIRDVNSAEWIRFGDELWQPSDAIGAFPEDSESIAIGAEGFGEWRREADGAARSFAATMTGDGARWVVYDASFTLTADSLCGGESGLSVPAGGYVQFLGAPGAAFDLSAIAE